MPPILIIIVAVIALVIVGSIVMIFIRKLRKAGLIIFGSLVIIFGIAGTWIFYPKHYVRNYLQQSTAWKNLELRQYADSIDFYIGAIPGGSPISDPMFYNNFNSSTPENALKMGPLFRNKEIGNYDFSHADSIVDMALLVAFCVVIFIIVFFLPG